MSFFNKIKSKIGEHFGHISGCPFDAFVQDGISFKYSKSNDWNSSIHEELHKGVLKIDNLASLELLSLEHLKKGSPYIHPFSHALKIPIKIEENRSSPEHLSAKKAFNLKHGITIHEIYEKPHVLFIVKEKLGDELRKCEQTLEAYPLDGSLLLRCLELDDSLARDFFSYSPS